MSDAAPRTSYGLALSCRVPLLGVVARCASLRTGSLLRSSIVRRAFRATLPGRISVEAGAPAWVWRAGQSLRSRAYGHGLHRPYLEGTASTHPRSRDPERTRSRGMDGKGTGQAPEYLAAGLSVSTGPAPSPDVHRGRWNRLSASPRPRPPGSSGLARGGVQGPCAPCRPPRSRTRRAATTPASVCPVGGWGLGAGMSPDRALRLGCGKVCRLTGTFGAAPPPR